MVVARWIIACREQQHDTCFLASMFFSCYHTRKSFFFVSGHLSLSGSCGFLIFFYTCITL